MSLDTKLCEILTYDGGPEIDADDAVTIAKLFEDRRAEVFIEYLRSYAERMVEYATMGCMSGHANSLIKVGNANALQELARRIRELRNCLNDPDEEDLSERIRLSDLPPVS